mmetsp:Transcript_11374/g.31784  ORF Transcript_11374/g.31784 Transcript_11374/m.31784 type:complete len:155 (-) Transcript_11374:198-662(-)
MTTIATLSSRVRACATRAKAGTKSSGEARWRLASSAARTRLDRRSLGLGLGLMVLGGAAELGSPDQANAALNNRVGGPKNPYADMLKNKKAEGLSVEKLYESGGGACGNGYELIVEKVYGSKCVCTQEDVCGAGAEGERKDISTYERAFGGAKE